MPHANTPIEVQQAEDLRRRQAEEVYCAAYVDYLCRRLAAIATNRALLAGVQERMNTIFHTWILTYALTFGEGKGGDVVTREANILDPVPDRDGYYPVWKDGGIVRTRFLHVVKIEGPFQHRPTDGPVARRVPVPQAEHELLVAPHFVWQDRLLEDVPWELIPHPPTPPEHLPLFVLDDLRNRARLHVHDEWRAE